MWAYKIDLFKPKFGEIDWDKIRAERNAAVDEAAEPEDDEEEEEEEGEEEEEVEAVAADEEGRYLYLPAQCVVTLYEKKTNFYQKSVI